MPKPSGARGECGEVRVPDPVGRFQKQNASPERRLVSFRTAGRVPGEGVEQRVRGRVLRIAHQETAGEYRPRHARENSTHSPLRRPQCSHIAVMLYYSNIGAVGCFRRAAELLYSRCRCCREYGSMVPEINVQGGMIGL